MLNCFRSGSNGSSDHKSSGRITPNSADLPEPWIRYHDREGAQLFYDRDTKLISYLNPTILKEVQADDNKTGRDVIIQMKAKTGEPYGLDYSCPPKGRIVYMPLELWKPRVKNENGDVFFSGPVIVEGDVSIRNRHAYFRDYSLYSFVVRSGDR